MVQRAGLAAATGELRECGPRRHGVACDLLELAQNVKLKLDQEPLARLEVVVDRACRQLQRTCELGQGEVSVAVLADERPRGLQEERAALCSLPLHMSAWSACHRAPSVTLFCLRCRKHLTQIIS